MTETEVVERMIRKCALFAFGLIALHVGALAQQVPQVQNAICVLKTTNFAAPLNLNVTGSVEFTTLLNNGVPQIQISANFAGLNAGDTYSFHVHTFGTWSGDGTGSFLISDESTDLETQFSTSLIMIVFASCSHWRSFGSLRHNPAAVPPIGPSI